MLCLATFVDPTTGERGLLAVSALVYIFDPVAGGAALVIVDELQVAAIFKDPAAGRPRLACGCEDEVRIDPVAGGEALLVIDVGSGAGAGSLPRTWRQALRRTCPRRKRGTCLRPRRGW